MATNLYDETVEHLDDQDQPPGSIIPAPPPPTAPDDPIIARVRQRQAIREAQLRSTLRQASEVNPEQAAEARRLAQQFGASPSLVLRNLDQYRQAAAAASQTALHQETPHLAGWLSNPDNAAVAHDDLVPLGAMERALTQADTFFGGVSRFLGQGLYYTGLGRALQEVSHYAMRAGDVQYEAEYGAPAGEAPIPPVPRPAPLTAELWGGAIEEARLQAAAGMTGAAQGVAELSLKAGQAEYAQQYRGKGPLGPTLGTPGDPIADQPEFIRTLHLVRQHLNEAATRAAGDRSQLGLVERGVLGGVGSAAQMAMLLSLSAATGTPGPMLTGMGLQTFGTSYGETRDLGKSVLLSGARGGFDALVEVGTEYLPALWYVEDLKHNATLREFLKDQLMSELPGELAATTLQNLSDWAVKHPQGSLKDWGASFLKDYAGQLPGAWAETVISTLVTGGIMSGGGALKAAATRRLVTSLGGAASQSKVVERSKDATIDYVGSKVDGTPYEHLNAPIETFIQYWQDQGEDPQKMATLLTGDPTAFATAVKGGPGAVLPLKTSRYVAYVAGTPHNEFFANELKLDPRLDPEMTNVREVIESVQSLPQRMAATAQAAEGAEGAAPTPTLDQATEAFIAQFVGAGTPEDIARTNVALLHAKLATAVAKGVLTDAEAAEEMRRFTVSRAGMPAGPSAAPTGPVAAAAEPAGVPPTRAAEQQRQRRDAYLQHLGYSPEEVAALTDEQQRDIIRDPERVEKARLRKQQQAEPAAAPPIAVGNAEAEDRGRSQFAQAKEGDRLVYDDGETWVVGRTVFNGEKVHLYPVDEQGHVDMEHQRLADWHDFVVPTLTSQTGTAPATGQPVSAQPPVEPGTTLAQAARVEDYGGQHRPPDQQSGAPAHDLTGDGRIYPDDVYSADGMRIYGSGDAAVDRETFHVLNAIKGNPNAKVTIYRAVPVDVDQTEINPGDWVTINRKYAEDHGLRFAEEGGEGEAFKIIEKEVEAKDIFTNGDSIHEWGYSPSAAPTTLAQGPTPQTPPNILYQGGHAVEGPAAAPTFYSRLTRAVEQSKQTKASGAQWKATIKNAKIGVNRDEFALTRVEDLDDATTYTKQEVLDYLKANQIQVQEVTLGGQGERTPIQAGEFVVRPPTSAGTQQLTLDLGEHGYAAVQEVAPGGPWFGRVPPTVGAFGERMSPYFATQAEAEQWVRDKVARGAEPTAGQPTHFDLYQLPGAEPGTYREAFLTVPPPPGNFDPRKVTITRHRQSTTQGSTEVAYDGTSLGRFADDPTLQPDGSYAQQSEAEWIAFARAQYDKTRPGYWEDGHPQYRDIVNPLVRLRFNERVTEDGKRVLFLEEVQPPTARNQTQMPQLFQKNWREIALQWALRQAAARNLDGVAWTTGVQQADRYDLSKQISRVEYEPHDPGDYSLGTLVAYNKDGEVVLREQRLEPTELDEYVGKDPAEKLRQQIASHAHEASQWSITRDADDGMYYVLDPNGDYVGEGRSTRASAERELADIRTGANQWEEPPVPMISGLDLQVGGEGLQKLYDVDFRNVMNGLPAVRKHGGKVGTVNLRTAEATGYDIVEAGGGRWRLVDRTTGAVPNAPTFTSGADAEQWIADHATPTTQPALTMTPAIREAVLGGQPLFQEKRGQITIGPEGQLDIKLLETADLSTFLHEALGHGLFEIFGDIVERLQARDSATLTPAQQKYVADYQALLTALGVTDRSEIGVKEHEQVAKWMEQYLRTGEAPSVALRPVFARIRGWLLTLYQTLESLGAPLTPEVRGVFDRLFATDAAIEAAQAQAGVSGLFATPEAAGMSPEEFARYQASISDADRQAREGLDAQLQGEVSAAQTAQRQQQRESIHTQVETEVQQQPVYRALAAMEKGTTPAGEPLVEGEDPQPLKLSKAILVERYAGERMKEIPRSIITTGEDGLDPDLVAEMFGFSSGDALLQAVATAPDMDALIAQETDRRLAEATPSAVTDGTLPERGRNAVANEAREEVVRKELEALVDLEGAQQAQQREARPAPTPREALRQERKERTYERRWLEAEARLRIAIAEGRKQVEIDRLREEVRALRQQARGGAATIRRGIPSAPDVRREAQAQIARTKVADLQPQVYWHAANKAGRQATEHAARQEFPQAIAAKTQQLLNLALYREAVAQREAAEKGARWVREHDTKAARAKLGLAGQSYLDQWDAKLDQYEFKRVSQQVLDRRGDLQKWMAEQKGEGQNIDLPEALLDESRRVNYRQLTVEQFQGLLDGLKHLQHVAQFKNTLIGKQQKRDLAETAQTLADQIEKTGKPTPQRLTRAKTLRERVAKYGKQLAGAFLNADTILRALDGFTDLGPVYQHLKGGIDRAVVEDLIPRTNAAAERLSEINRVYKRGELTRAEVIPGVLEHGKPMSLTREEMLAIALNWGSPENRAALLESTRFAAIGADEHTVRAILDQLTQKDWTWVQSVWDYLETFWPEIEATQRRRTGLAPEKVEAMPVETRFGTVRGGYYTLKYDPEGSILVGQDELSDIYDRMRTGRFVAAATKAGFAKERVGSGGRNVLLSLRVISQHVNEVNYDLALGDEIRAVDRLLRHPTVRNAFQQAERQVEHETLTLWLNDVAATEVASTDPLSKTWRWVRSGGTVAVLGFNMSTALMNLVAPAQSAVVIGKRAMLRGMADLVTRPWVGERSVFRQVTEASPFMAERQTTFNKDITTAMETLKDDVVPSVVKKSLFYAITKLQWLADTATWLGAYNKGLAQFGEDEAKAVAYADRSVARAQGSGLWADRTAIERGTLSPRLRQAEFVKMWTTLMSYMLAKGNVAYEQTARTNFKSPTAVAGYTINLVLLFGVEALFAGLLRGQFDDDDDWGSWFATWLKETGQNMIQIAPFARDLADWTTGRPSGGPLAILGQRMQRAYTQVEQGEVDAELVKAINSLGGVLLHYPSEAINRVITAGTRQSEGEDVSLLDYFVTQRKAK